MALCPECEAIIDIGDELEEGETLDCPECGVELEVVNTNLVELDSVVDEEEEEEALSGAELGAIHLRRRRIGPKLVSLVA